MLSFHDLPKDTYIPGEYMLNRLKDVDLDELNRIINDSFAKEDAKPFTADDMFVMVINLFHGIYKSS